VTEPLWPSSVCTCSPVDGFHSLTVRSSDADASSWPSRENATAVTRAAVALERLHLLAGRWVPQPDRPIVRRRR
jgi:hypothetical protein